MNFSNASLLHRALTCSASKPPHRNDSDPPVSIGKYNITGTPWLLPLELMQITPLLSNVII
jgi:hypothetical protein